MDGKGNSVVFASIAGEMQDTSFSLSDNHAGLGITTEKGAWLFGQSAMEQSTFGSHQQNVDWILSDEYHAGILLAITQLTKASRVDVELTLSLPFETIKSHRKMVIDMMHNIEGEHTVKSLDGDNQKITISFPRRHPVVPQNVAPVLRHMIDKHGNMRLPQTDEPMIYVGLCNGGSHTVELSTCKIVLSGNYDFDALQGRSEALGTYALSDVIRPMIQAKYPNEAAILKKDHKLFEIMSTGLFKPYNQVHDVSDIIARPKEQYCQSIVNLCNNVWSDVTPIKKPELWGFIASGGGANIFVDSLEKWHPNVVKSDNTQMDVVEGMRRLRKMLDKENG